jgi:hypothetical protein
MFIKDSFCCSSEIEREAEKRLGFRAPKVLSLAMTIHD